MHRTKFRDAELIRTPGWPVVFAMCAALAIVIYALFKFAV
jgi:hypothetical protein